MPDHFHTFTANEEIPNAFVHSKRYGQLTIGKVGADDFGGGSLLIKKATVQNPETGRHVIRTIDATAFAALEDKTIRLELPAGTDVYVELTGATNPNLYVDYRDQRDRS